MDTPNSTNDPGAGLYIHAAKVINERTIRMAVLGRVAEQSVPAVECVLDYTFAGDGKGHWSKVAMPTGWGATEGIAVNSLGHICTIESSGRVWVETGDAPPQEERLFRKKRGEPALREVFAVGPHFYASDSYRQCYRREANGAWRRIDRGLALTPPLFSIMSIISDHMSSLDGIGDSELYAATFFGGIWHYQDNGQRGFFAAKPKWHNVTPLSIKGRNTLFMSKIRIIREGLAYACGDSAEGPVLLKGWGDRWESIPIGDMLPPGTKMGTIEWHDNRLLLFLLNGIYALGADDNPVAVSSTIDQDMQRDVFDVQSAHGLLLAHSRDRIQYCDSAGHWHDITPRPQEILAMSGYTKT